MGIRGWILGCLGWVCLLMGTVHPSPLFKQSSPMTSILGSSAIGLRMGSDALGVNPAAVNMTLPPLLGLSMGSVYDQQVQSMMIGASLPIQPNVRLLLGVAAQLIGDIPETIMLPNGMGSKVGSFSDITIHNKAGICIRLTPEWQIAGAMGLMSHYVANEVGNQTSIDVGSHIRWGGIEWGISALNLLKNPIQWGSGNQESTEMTLGMGMGLALNKGISIRNGWEWADGKPIGSAGLLVSWWDELVIVVGLSDITSRMKPSGGISLELDRISIQYGVSSHEQLGLSHRVGLHLVM